MTQIRIIRVIEYVYTSPEAAESDMKRWTNVYTAPNGSVSLTSVTLPFSTISNDAPLPSGIAAEIERLRPLLTHQNKTHLTPWEVVELAADQFGAKRT